MNVGTKSLLFGVHQFLWHPLTVALAYRRLYGRLPRWEEAVAILVHDWGYWGASDMDGPSGRPHPVTGASLASRIVYRVGRILGYSHLWCATTSNYIYEWTLGHSREYAKLEGTEPSKLCWADKYCVLLDPKWFYLLRARLSGELVEYMDNAMPIAGTLLLYTVIYKDREAAEIYWLNWYRNKVCNLPEIAALIRK